MGIDLDAKLVETASKVVTTTNGYGDTVYGTSSPTPCLYRDISLLAKKPNQLDVKLDGLLWFNASESVVRGDIYYHPLEGYLKIEAVTRAKRLVGDNSTQFFKCGVSKQRQVS